MDENLLQILIKAIDQASPVIAGVRAQVGQLASATVEGYGDVTAALGVASKAQENVAESMEVVHVSAARGREILAQLTREQTASNVEAINLKTSLIALGSALHTVGRIFGETGGEIGQFTEKVLQAGSTVVLLGAALTKLAKISLGAVFAAVGALAAAFAGLIGAIVGAGGVIFGLKALADAWQPNINAQEKFTDDIIKATAATRDLKFELQLLAQEQMAVPRAIEDAWDALDDVREKFLVAAGTTPGAEEQRTVILRELGIITDEFASIPEELKEPLGALADQLREILDLTTSAFEGTTVTGAGVTPSDVVSGALADLDPETRALVNKIIEQTVASLFKVKQSQNLALHAQQTGEAVGAFELSGDPFQLSGDPFSLQGDQAAPTPAPQTQAGARALAGGFVNYGTVNVIIPSADEFLRLQEILAGGV